MKHSINSVIARAALLGSYHQFPVVAQETRTTPQIGDVTVVDRWDESRGAWNQVRLTWNGAEYVAGTVAA
jgi:hypothetical protein